MTEKEKKKRIKELRAELKELLAVPKSEWHEAFEAFLRLQTFKYEGVTIQTEVEVGTEPPRTDYIILVQDGDVHLRRAARQMSNRLLIPPQAAILTQQRDIIVSCYI